LRVYLSKELDNKKKKVFKDLKFVDSKSSVLLQLADMIAGSIAAYYKSSESSYFKKLQKKGRIERVIELK